MKREHDSEFIRLYETERDKHKAREKKRRAKWEAGQKALDRFLTGNSEDVKKVIACLTTSSASSALDVANRTGIDYKQAEEILRKLADHWILRPHYHFLSETIEFPEDFYAYVNSWLKREEGDYYRDAVLAALKDEFVDEAQERASDLPYVLWTSELESKALKLENAMLRVDLKMALCDSKGARANAFLGSFVFATKRRIRSELMQAGDGPDFSPEQHEKAYQFCQRILDWDTHELDATVRGVAKHNAIYGTSGTQKHAILLMFARIAKAYLEVYEKCLGEGPQRDDTQKQRRIRQMTTELHPDMEEFL